MLFCVLSSAFASKIPKQKDAFSKVLSQCDWSWFNFLFFAGSLLGKAVVLSIAIIDSIQLKALAILRLSAIQVTKAP